MGSGEAIPSEPPVARSQIPEEDRDLYLYLYLYLSCVHSLVFKCAGALKCNRDEFAIAGKERAAQRSDDVRNGRKLAMDLLFPRSAKS